MKKLSIVLILATLISCTKESNYFTNDLITQNNTRDLIDQNFFFFFSVPKIVCIGYSKKGLCLQCINPIPVGKYENKFHYEWSWIRTDKGGLKTCTDIEPILNPVPGTSVILKIWAERVGTNIKSDIFITGFLIK